MAPHAVEMESMTQPDPLANATLAEMETFAAGAAADECA